MASILANKVMSMKMFVLFIRLDILLICFLIWQRFRNLFFEGSALAVMDIYGQNMCEKKVNSDSAMQSTIHIYIYTSCSYTPHIFFLRTERVQIDMKLLNSLQPTLLVWQMYFRVPPIKISCKSSISFAIIMIHIYYIVANRCLL